MDIQILEDQLKGLEAKGKELRANEEIFLKAKGLDETIESSRGDMDRLEIDLIATKEELSELQGKKNEAIQKTAAALAEKMGEILPYGKAVFDIDSDGNVFIGWETLPDELKVPHHGLSGGEKSIFDSALVYALGCNIIIQEAAELDNDNLSKTLLKLADIEIQSVVNTWFQPSETAEGWNVVNV